MRRNGPGELVRGVINRDASATTASSKWRLASACICRDKARAGKLSERQPHASARTSSAALSKPIISVSRDSTVESQRPCYREVNGSATRTTQIVRRTTSTGTAATAEVNWLLQRTI